MKIQRIMRSLGVFLLLLLGSAQAARAELAAVGPVDPNNGFPTWYQDVPGTQLELCLDGDGLTGPCFFDPVIATNLWSVQTGFGAEAFYWYADTTMLGAGAVDALLVLGLEAAYGAGDPASGDQITFGRVRVRVAGLPVGGRYTVIHPYGTQVFDVVLDPLGKRDINFTSDIGIGPFTGALRSEIGPFLRWAGADVADPARPYVDPASGIAYLGNPQVPHAVTGSPFGTNFFMIIGPRGAVLNPVNGSNVLSTNLFNLSGKLATRVGVTVDRAAYQRDAFGAGFVDVFATSLPGQTIQVTGVGAAAVTMREEPGLGRYYARIAFDGATITLPATVTVTNTLDIPPQPVTVPVTDTVWALNYYDTLNQSLLFSALSSDLGVPQVFTVVDAPFLGPGVVAPPAFLTQTSAPGGGSDTEPVLVTQINRPPGITSTPVTAALVGAPYSYQVTAIDDPANTFTYSLDAAPAGMTISAAGLISWIPPAPVPPAVAPYTADVTVRVTDQGGLFATQPFTITVGENLPPVITSTPVLTGTGNQPYSYQVVATEPNGEVMAYALGLGAPAGMTISATGLVAWTPTAVGDYPVTVRVTDPAGLFAEQSFTISVAVVNFAPVITSTPPAAALLVGATFTYALAASDTVGDVLTYSLDVFPAGMTIDAAGAISFTSAAAGNFPVTARVTDQGGLFATQSFVVTFALPNVAPVITSTPTAVALLNRTYSFQMTATDAPGSVLTWSLDVAPGGMAISPAGFITWVPTAPISAAVTARVTDQGGLSSALAFTIVARQQEVLKFTRAEYSRARATWAFTGTDNLPGNIITVHADTATGPTIASALVLADGTWSYAGPGLIPLGATKKVVAVSQTGVTQTVSLGLR